MLSKVVELLSSDAGKAFGITDFINPDECGEPIQQVAFSLLEKNLLQPSLDNKKNKY